MNRTATVTRKTKETEVSIQINLDGKGESTIDTGVGFFDHMLNSFSRHSFIDLIVKSKGDLHVDDHHTVEDVGLCIGEAIQKALGEKKGINRFGWALCPMDEALTRVAIDISGRPYFMWELPINLHRIGDFHTETVPEFFKALATKSGIALHMELLHGKNLHHIIESFFKSFAKALNHAVALQGQDFTIPSTKGTL
jgi:imidazoleglycerol-phosphate dehydratase